MEKYTSLGLSKKLNDAGFKGESEMYWENIQKKDFVLTPKETLLEIVPNSEGWTYLDEGLSKGNVIPAYDILNDLCVKYYMELFGGNRYVVLGCIESIIELLQQGKKEDCEKYLWDNCLFNNNN